MDNDNVGRARVVLLMLKWKSIGHEVTDKEMSEYYLAINDELKKQLELSDN